MVQPCKVVVSKGESLKINKISLVKIEKDIRVAPFIKEIFLLESESDSLHNLPFYADGYPGIIFSETQEGVVQPKNKAESI